MNLSDLIYVKENVLDHEFCGPIFINDIVIIENFKEVLVLPVQQEILYPKLNLTLKKCLD